jgi:hypothetical protein
MVPGMGGAMDLVTGAKRVVVAMQHSAKGKSKVVQKCTLPLTSTRTVDLVVTELAVISFAEGGARLVETAPGITAEQVVANTEASLVVPGHIDFDHVVALVATTTTEDVETIVAGGRYITTMRPVSPTAPKWPSTEEDQGRGIARLLLRHLVRIARDNGVLTLSLVADKSAATRP